MSHNFQTRPLYLQLRDALLQKIRSQEWEPGQQLPNEQSVASEFGVSQGTVRKAMAVLEDEHIIERRQGRGTFVTAMDPEQLVFRFYKIRGVVGMPTGGESSIEVGAPTELEQQCLGLRPAHKVIRVHRVRELDGRPLFLEVCALPQNLFPKLAKQETYNGFILMTCFEEAGVIAQRASEKVRAIAAVGEKATKLSVPEGTPLLETERIIYDSNGRPFEFRIRTCHLDKDGYYEADID